TGKSFKEVQINPGCIWVATSISEDKSSVIIRIRDNGIGMTEATKQRIFENLFTTKAVGKGTGLGLAISHQIVVEKHQGTITVNSELGSGTEFVIQIPIQETSVTLD
ncbi:MAG: sensor histidine kinase, partial [Microcoleaceae cyanobacterium]